MKPDPDTSAPNIKKKDFGSLINAASDVMVQYAVGGEKIKVIRRVLGANDDISVVVDAALIQGVQLGAGEVGHVIVTLPNDHQFSDVPMVYTNSPNVVPLGVTKAPFDDRRFIVALKNTDAANAVTVNVLFIVKSINFNSIKHIDYSLRLGEVKAVDMGPSVMSELAEMLGFNAL